MHLPTYCREGLSCECISIHKAQSYIDSLTYLELIDLSTTDYYFYLYPLSDKQCLWNGSQHYIEQQQTTLQNSTTNSRSDDDQHLTIEDILKEWKAYKVENKLF